MVAIVVPQKRAWAVSGPLAGLLVVVAMWSTPSMTKEEESAGGQAFVEIVHDASGVLILSSVAAFGASAALVVFGAGLRRRMQTPGSIAADVAFGSCVASAALTALLAVVRALLSSTEDMPMAGVEALHELGLGLGSASFAVLALAAGAVTVAGLRERCVPWALGVISGVLAALVVVAVATSGPWLAWLPMGVWLVATGVVLGQKQGALQQG